MIIGLFICLCVLLKNICTDDTVYSQVKVEGVIGDPVLLPCKSSKNEQNLQDINVLWRYNDSTNVLAIINGKDSVEHQKSKFKNRIKTVSDNYKKGNFTLILNNLTRTDAGTYQCYITHSSELVTVQLHVNETLGGKPSDVGGREKWTVLIWIFVLLFIVTVFIVIARVIKMCTKTTSLGESATEVCMSCPVSFQQISNTSQPTSQNHQDYSGLPANV